MTYFWIGEMLWN